MSIEFRCGNCQQAYRVADTLAGRRVACKKCGQPVAVPALPGPEVAAAAPIPAQPAPVARPQASAPYGVSAVSGTPGSGRMKRGANIVFIIGAAAMFLGFFLPWISIDAGIMTMNWGAYQMPYAFNSLLDMLINILKDVTDPEGKKTLEQLKDVRARGNFLYVVYLIPALTLGAVVEEFFALGRGRNSWWLRALAATSPIIAFIAVTIAFSGLESSQPKQSRPDSNPFELFKLLSTGFYISAAGFLVATAGIFTSPKAKAAQPEMQLRRTSAPRPAATLPRGAGPRPGLKPRLPGKPKLPGPRA